MGRRFSKWLTGIRPATHGRALALLALAVMLAVIAAAYGVFTLERERLRATAIRNLSGIADTKLRALEVWRRDRLTEISLLSENPLVRDSMLSTLEGDSGDAQELLRLSFTPLVSIQRYDSFYLLDAEGRLRFELGAKVVLPPQVMRLAQVVLATGRPQLMDTHVGDDLSRIRLHLLTAVPARDDPRVVAGVMGVQIQPGYALASLVSTWPGPSASGEVLLIRPEQGRTLFVTAPLRGSTGMLLTEQQARVAARALRESGPLEGTDYRGEPVLGMAASVPGTPWRLLVKMDQDEVFEPIRELASWIVGVTLLLIAVASALVYLWWRAERERDRAEAAREREALARHFDYLAKYANDIIILADKDGRILEVNDRAEHVHGHSREQLKRMHLVDLRAPEDKALFKEQWSHIEKGRPYTYEVRTVAADGRVIPLEVSARMIEVDGKVFYQAIGRDISERKAAEQKLQRANRLYAVLSRTNETIVRVHDRQALFEAVCRIAVEAGQFRDAWIGRLDERAGALVSVAHAGAHHDFFMRQRLSLEEDTPGSVGVSRCAALKGEACVSNDFVADSRTSPWSDFAELHRVRSAASLPILENGRVVGVYSVYSDEPGVFDDEMLSLLREIADAISFALEAFRRDELRQQAETETREGEYRYRQLIDNMSSGMVVYEPTPDGQDFITRDVNRAFQKIERVPREEVVDIPLTKAFPQSRDIGLLAALQRVHRTGQPEVLQLEISTDRTSGWRDCYIYRLPTGEVVQVYDDITEQKHAEQRLRHSEERLALVLQGVNDGYWDINLETDDYYFSQRFAEMFGYSMEELAHLADAWIALVHPADRPRVEAELQAHFDGRLPRYESEHRMLRKDGKELWVHAVGSVVRRAPDGRPLRLTGTHRDITDRKHEENQLRLWATVFEDSRQGIFITDEERRIISANRAFQEITGYTMEEMLGQNPRMFASGEQDRAFYQNMWASLNTTDHWQGEIWDRRKNGEVFPLYTSITATRDAQGELQNYIAICTDISERKAAEERIRYLAHHDVLTGLPNRALFEDRLEQAIAHAQRTETRLGVMFVDLDRFKNINDSLGHHLGDELLKQVGARLRACVRMDDTVSRQGGDEFILLTSELGDAADAGHVAKKIIDAIAEPFRLDGNEIRITASIGIAIYPEDGADGDTLIRNADAAMYLAKERGRNNFQFFIRELNLRALKRISIESALRRAVDQGDLVLHYQPQVNIWSGVLSGTEALVRWQWHDRLVPPAEFIPIAEESGLIHPIGEWVLAEACRQQRSWMNAGLRPVTMAVNISAAQFHRKELLRVLQDIISSHCATPTQLEMELTEGMIMQDAEASIGLLGALKEMGVTLAIDDFGTGYSSLNYLRRFRIDRLKVDQSFVRDLDKDPADRAITEAIIALGKSLGLRVIAEGVERHLEIELLRESRCDELQGFYFAPPLAADAFVEWFRRREQGDEVLIPL
ncbi:MAG: PAS domain S-box protein [Thiohalomonadaceae bacterium]